jgi:hypothetical protein
LSTYPLKYHKNETKVRQDLIERGKKFVSLGGVHYKSLDGMAYYKKKKSVVRVNINGRVMVDPSTHRRINPNYPISIVRPKDHDLISDGEDSDDDDSDDGCCMCGSDDDDDGGDAGALDDVKIKMVTKVYKDRKGLVRTMRIPKALVEGQPSKEKLDKVASKEGAGDDDSKKEEVPEDDADEELDTTPVFSDEEYLIASPVVLGFAFTEKLWLEFTVSAVKEISWNEQAYQSLVLEPSTKEIVKVRLS